MVKNEWNCISTAPVCLPGGREKKLLFFTLAILYPKNGGNPYIYIYTYIHTYILSSYRARQFCRMETLRLPGHSLTATVLRKASEEMQIKKAFLNKAYGDH